MAFALRSAFLVLHSFLIGCYMLDRGQTEYCSCNMQPSLRYYFCKRYEGVVQRLVKIGKARHVTTPSALWPLS